MYELRQLRTFQAVAARQNVTRAAAALGYAQSSVTAQIQALEEDVWGSTFRPDRPTRGTDKSRSSDG